MRFRGCCGLLILLALLAGCEADLPSQEEVFADAAQRVEANLLPPLVAESEAVLRNLLNLFTALPELCATPLAQLGAFVSALPALGAPDEVAFDDAAGRWTLQWRNVVLGEAAAPAVDVTLRVVFRAQDGFVLRAVPFSLAPRSTLALGGEPPSLRAGNLEGYFLFQDPASGVWTLRWRALGSPKVFAGRINAEAVSRVRRRLADGAAVDSLAVDAAARQISFSETTAPGEEKGFSFFVRPGETVRFRLRLGPSPEDVTGITRAQLRLGATDAELPASQDPADFTLASNLPLQPATAPQPVPGTDLGTFVWQETEGGGCGAGEEAWRLRFSTAAAGAAFSGTVSGLDGARLRGQPVGGCPPGSLADEGRRFSYACTLPAAAVAGYDLCATAGRRLSFSPELEEVREAARVFIGAARHLPPSPDPFTVEVGVELAERSSPRDVRVSEATVVLRGNNDDPAALPLQPDQVSLEPLCRLPGVVQPPVRLTGSGDYATARAAGNTFELDNLEFVDAAVAELSGLRRFPDRGEVRLRTRVDLDPAEVRLPAATLAEREGTVVGKATVELTVNNVRFTFPEQEVVLGRD